MKNSLFSPVLLKSPTLKFMWCVSKKLLNELLSYYWKKHISPIVMLHYFDEKKNIFDKNEIFLSMDNSFTLYVWHGLSVWSMNSKFQKTDHLTALKLTPKKIKNKNTFFVFLSKKQNSSNSPIELRQFRWYNLQLLNRYLKSF